MSSIRSMPNWIANPWSSSWRAEVPTAEIAVWRLLEQIRNDLYAGAYREGLHVVVPTGATFHIASMVDDGLYTVRGAEHLELRRAFARVLVDAACGVEVQHAMPRSTIIAVEWPDFTIEILTAQRRDDGLGEFEIREGRRPVQAADYPMLHPNWNTALGRGWWG